MDLPKTYNPQEVEDGIYQKWEKSGFFNPDRLEKAADKYWKAEPFFLPMPPANVTSELHLGSAMFLTIEDVMTRYARMSGRKTLWLPGTDHAAIATQNVVERELWEKEKKTRHDIGREELLRRIEEFIQKTKGRIQLQIRKIGSSCDWSREKYTLSPELSLAVRTMFKKMYDAGLIYRGNRIVNWCPRCGTTLADDEVTYKEVKGSLYYISYPLSKGGGHLTISTARPETMLADTALAVHPEDDRYQKYVGKTAMLPLVNRELPIVADPGVDREFGSGVLKVTPAHDPHDFEIGKRHHLPIINIITTDGKIDEREAFDHGFEDYANLPLPQALEKIIQALKDERFLEKTESLIHNVGFCYRCETRVEPIISKQWFVNVNQKIKIKNPSFGKLLKLSEEASLKEIATATVKTGTIKIVPERFAKTYLQWMENLRDWNISRQIWFGHRIPVWYCGQAKEAEFPKMGFHESVVLQVFKGKTTTWRLRDHGFQVGDRVAFENSQNNTIFGYATINEIEHTTIQQLPLNDPSHYAAYQNHQEIIEAFKRLNPERAVSEKTEVYIYRYNFAPLENTAETCGETIVAITDPEKCPTCGNPHLIQDPDTLDTWFSSSLWTFSTLGWPKDTPDLKIYRPASILETGYDILFFWVARMILMTSFALKDVPFKTVYLHGLVTDEKGQKMSKSKGNAINPLEMIKKYGTDALRLSLILGTTPGNNTKVVEKKIQNYRNFVNKLWNISRFILQQTGPMRKKGIPKAQTLADEWILGETAKLVTNVRKNLDTYQYGLAGESLLDFTWNKLADWYIEISKIKNQKSNAAEILPYVLSTLLQLWHPFIPFVTEQLWSQLSPELLIVADYPHPEKPKGPPGKIKQDDRFPTLQELITGLRNLRAEYRQDPGETFSAYLELPQNISWLAKEAVVVDKLARVKLNFDSVPQDKKMPYFLWQNAKVYLIIPNFDPRKEKTLTQKELQKISAVLAGMKKQLQRKEFLDKAPPEVVTNMQENFKAALEREKQLKAKIKQL